MIALKPGRRFCCLAAGFHQIIHILPKRGVAQCALDPVARGSLQDDPWVVRDLPEPRIKLPPHLIGGMVPGPVHVQGEFRQGIETLDSGREEMVSRVVCREYFAHCRSLPAGTRTRACWHPRTYPAIFRRSIRVARVPLHEQLLHVTPAFPQFLYCLLCLGVSSEYRYNRMRSIANLA